MREPFTLDTQRPVCTELSHRKYPQISVHKKKLRGGKETKSERVGGGWLGGGLTGWVGGKGFGNRPGAMWVQK